MPLARDVGKESLILDGTLKKTKLVEIPPVFLSLSLNMWKATLWIFKMILHLSVLHQTTVILFFLCITTKQKTEAFDHFVL